MSKTMVVSPIVSAILKSEDILGKDRRWKALNPNQDLFLEKFFSKKGELRGFSKKELRNWVSLVAAEFNEILKNEGFNIKLDDFRPNEFGVVSILDVLVEWLVRGEKTKLPVDGVLYSAVKIEPSTMINGARKDLFRVYDSPGHKHPVVMLYTKSGDELYMAIADRALGDFPLISRIEEIRSSLSSSKFHYDYLVFPMVDLNHQVDIGWLKGMRTIDIKGQEYYISQALQQTKFKMNELGARVKSAVAITMRSVSIKREEPLLIDKPFFLWIEREGMTIPIMYAYIDAENWKDPGNLNM